MGEAGTSGKLRRSEKFLLYFKGMLTGIVSGFVVVAYRAALAWVEELRGFVSGFAGLSSAAGAAAFFAGLIACALLTGFILEKCPIIRGGGILQVKMALLRKLRFSWCREMLLKFAGGVISFGCGLSLGRAGPSVHLGALSGSAVASFGRHRKIEEKYLLTAGAGAGLAATFNAPLAGVLFALEELQKNFSTAMLGCILAASLAAEIISDYFFGQSTVFHFHIENFLPLRTYPVLIVLGLLGGLLGKIFSESVLYSMDAHDRLFKKTVFKPLPAFLAAGLLAVFLPEILGSGNGLVTDSLVGAYGAVTLCVFLVTKLFFTALSYGSGAPGGIFFPLLVMGALLGRAYGDAMVFLAGFDSIYMINFTIFGMAAFFTAVVRAPITGVILISEMTGSLGHLIPLIAVSAIAFAASGMLNTKPIYDAFLDRFLAAGNSPGDFPANRPIE